MAYKDKYAISFRDVDGTNYIASFSDLNHWTASMDKKDVMLWGLSDACKVRDELQQHWRYNGHPDEGFFQVKILAADEQMYSDWAGPSGELVGYLSEGNSKEDLVKLLWEKMTLEQRNELEEEVSQYMEVYSQTGFM